MPIAASVFSEDLQNIFDASCESPKGPCNFSDLLQQGNTDSLLVLHHGRVVAKWNDPAVDLDQPHILFSISKSLTAVLAGIMEAKGIIDSEDSVINYLPGVSGGAYEDCTIRHLLDMTVALEFEENYVDQQSEYIQYRIATGWNPVDQTNPGRGLESFLYSLKRSSAQHGGAFLYRSPNSDLLGLLLERAANRPLADLLSMFLWQPMGAQSTAYITLDQYGIGRGAGGICVTIHDLARIGQLFLDGGQVDGRQVISPSWILDTCNNGSQEAWDKGNYKHKLPNGKYRNKWYQTGDADNSICARGIHGQLLYINPTRSVVIAKQASQPEPLNDKLTVSTLQAFDFISKLL